MNAPEPGTIKEYLAREEDTVTVGQDLVKLELGGAQQRGDKQDGGQKPKAPAEDVQSTSSDPEPQKNEGTSGQDSSTTTGSSEIFPKKETESLKQKERKQSGAEREQSPSKAYASDNSESKKTDAKATGSDGPYGNREERRVCHPDSTDVFIDAISRLK